MNKSPSKISFELRAEEDRSISESRCVSNLERKRIKASLYKTYFRTSSGRGMKPFQASCERGKEYHFESRAKEKRSHRVIKNSKPRAKERQSINSSGIPNLVRKRKGILLQTSCGRGKEHQSSQIISNLERKRNETIPNLMQKRKEISLRISCEREKKS